VEAEARDRVDPGCIEAKLVEKYIRRKEQV
jgi:hypothetical protein